MFRCSALNLIRALSIRVLVLTALCVSAKTATGQIQLPAIDPSGNRIFLPAPNSTSLMGPHAATGGGWFGNLFRRPAPVAPTMQPPGTSFQFSTPNGLPTPAYQHPANVPGCNGTTCNKPNKSHIGSKQHVIPKPSLVPTRGQLGEIIMTPSRIVAPVGSEVVVLAGICGGDGHFVLNQPLEWMVSNDSVGQIIEVGGMEHPAFNDAVAPHSKKFDGQYATGRTGLKEKLLTRGTPTPVDDIDVLKGQTYISLSSASAGTTYLTCVAPKAQAWDKRRAQTVIHWVDGVWSIPTPVVATSGTVQPLTSTVTRVNDGSGISGWKVRYTIVGGVPAEFAPTGSQQAELETDANGQATVQLRQQAGKALPGTTQVRVDVIRPGVYGEQELQLESALTSVTWSAPALTIRTLGPRSIGVNESFNYRVEVSNPGDQTSRNVVVTTDDISGDVQYISSNPKPAEYGTRYEWQLGDIPPNSTPRTIDVQMKSDKRGMRRLCFEVNSATDNLKTEACGETEIAAPCLGVNIVGPTAIRTGEQASFEIKLINQCNEPLQNVTLNVQYDNGLQAVSLGNPIVANIGTLQFGEEKSLPLVFDVTGSGVQCFTLNVSAEGGHTAAARRCLDVTQSVQGQASIEVSGDRVVRVGDLTQVTALVRNTGNVALETITVLNRFSPSLDARQISAYPPGQLLGSELAFSINRLEPGQTVPIKVEYGALEPDGNAFSQFSVSTPSGAAAEQRWNLAIDPSIGGGQPNPVNPNPPVQPNNPGIGNGGIGIPADPAGELQITVQPLEAIPADGKTVGRVKISVRNSRTISDRNVDIALFIPPGTRILKLDTSEAQLNATPTDNQYREIRIDRRMELRADETLEFVAHLVADQPGQPVIEVTANSDNTLGTASGKATLNATPIR